MGLFPLLRSLCPSIHHRPLQQVPEAVATSGETRLSNKRLHAQEDRRTPGVSAGKCRFSGSLGMSDALHGAGSALLIPVFIHHVPCSGSEDKSLLIPPEVTLREGIRLGDTRGYL